MVASHGSDTDVMGNGFVLSDFLNTASFSGNRDSAETTTFKKKARTYVPGLKDTTLNMEGIFDGDLNAVDQILAAALGANGGLFSYFPMGSELAGNLAYTLDTVITTYEVTTDVGDVAQISAEFQGGIQGRFIRGVVGRTLMTVPAGTATGGASSYEHDNGAAVTGGPTASIVMHVFSIIGTARFTLQHSGTSGGTFSDVGTAVLDVTQPGSYRLMVPFAGNLLRFTRIRYAPQSPTYSGSWMGIIERNK